MRKPLFLNNKGSMLMQVMTVTAVISIGFYFLSDYVIAQKQQIGKTINAVNLRFALNSTMDYVLFGMRQKYCFTDDDLLMNAPTDQCNLVHTGSVERLIMSNDQANFIIQLINSGTNVGPVDKANLPLKSISRYLRIDNATTVHPLFSVLQSLKYVKDETTGKAIKVDGVSVSLTRDESGYLPQAGREVYLKATISLKSSKTATSAISIGTTPLTLTSQIVIYPREVGSFALMIAKDLHLDKSYNAPMDTGDAAFHMFSSKSASGGGQGLVFLSPVFVNQDIYLPPDTRAAGSTASYNGAYSAVTFADRVYLGNGWIRNSDGGLFVPRSSGNMTDRFWSDIPTFGGFLRGIENDGGLDRGLQVFGKVISGSSPDSNLMSQCIERSQNMSSSTYLYKSQLAATLKDDNTNNFRYRLFVDKKNEFVGQENPRVNPDVSKFGAGTATRKNSSGGIIMKLSFILGSRIMTAQMTATSTLTVTPEVGSPELKSQLQAAMKTAQTSLTAAKDKLTTYNNNLSTAQASLAAAKKALSTEEAKPVMPTPTPTPVPTATPTPTPNLNITPTPSPSPSPTVTPDGSSSSSTSSTPSTESSVAADSSPSPSPSATVPTATSTPVVMVSPTPTPTPVPKGYYQDPDLIASLKAQISALQTTISQLQNTDIPNQQDVVTSADKAVLQAQKDLSIFDNPPQFVIQMSPVYSRWGTFDDRVDMQITATNVQNLLDAKGNLIKPSIGILGYDATYYNEQPIKNPANPNLLRFLNFNFTANKSILDAPDSMSETSSSGNLAGVAEDETDYAHLDVLCEEARSAAASQSFGGASWNVDFSGATRSSWNFAGDSSSVLGHDPVFDKTLTLDSGADGVFKVYSIAKECVIQASANLITGFYTCDSLRIEARQKPLRIIGTFIVGKLSIDPSAYKAGITWSSIYHPQVTQELRAVGVLKSVSGASCNAPKNPIWHPKPSVQEVADRMSCNVISLRAKADPFQWTAVDPDCGLVSGASNTTCKRRLVRFFVVEQAREGGR